MILPKLKQKKKIASLKFQEEQVLHKTLHTIIHLNHLIFYFFHFGGAISADAAITQKKERARLICYNSSLKGQIFLSLSLSVY